MPYKTTLNILNSENKVKTLHTNPIYHLIVCTFIPMKQLPIFILLILASTCLAQPKREMRGLWICTAYNLDWPSTANLDSTTQKQELIQILDQAQALHLNTIFFQVRAAGDAFYQSKTEPWSHWLTGRQGKSALYDPLTFITNECHKRGLELHAWFNLFRAVSHYKFSPPGPTHFATLHPNWCYTAKKKKMLNPGVPEARGYAVKIINEVVCNYDIDGVHLDDYFYKQETNNYKIPDQKTFKQYGKGWTSIKDWRRNNLNLLIDSIYSNVKRVKFYVKFGVSPIPTWRHKHQDPRGSDTKTATSCYEELYADTYKWYKNGWLDYIIPQGYWGIQHSFIGYKKVSDWWGSIATDRHIYIGQAIYKVGNDERKGWDSAKEIVEQIKINRANKNISGQGFYKASSLKANTKNITTIIQNKIYPSIALPPTMPWLDSIPPHAPHVLRHSINSNKLTFNWDISDRDISYYILYKFNLNEIISLNNSKNINAVIKGNNYTCNLPLQDCVYIITAVDRLHNESTNFSGTLIELK